MNFFIFSWHLLLLLLIAPINVQARIDASTGLINASGFELVKSQCTICHSGRLIESQRLSEQDWIRMIRWMQAEHGLWSLGNLEEPIVRYLTKHYGVPVKFNGRRKPIKETQRISD